MIYDSVHTILPVNGESHVLCLTLTARRPDFRISDAEWKTTKGNRRCGKKIAGKTKEDPIDGM